MAQTDNPVVTDELPEDLRAALTEAEPWVRSVIKEWTNTNGYAEHAEAALSHVFRSPTQTVVEPSKAIKDKIKPYIVNELIHWARSRRLCDMAVAPLVRVFGRTPKGGWRDSEGFDCGGFDADGYNKDGYNADGVDRDNYVRLYGYDDSITRGYHRVTGRDREGFDRNGYHQSGGYNRKGFNRYGQIVNVERYMATVIQDLSVEVKTEILAALQASLEKADTQAEG